MELTPLYISLVALHTNVDPDIVPALELCCTDSLKGCPFCIDVTTSGARTNTEFLQALELYFISSFQTCPLCTCNFNWFG